VPEPKANVVKLITCKRFGMTILAAKYGKQVFCEKIPAISMKTRNFNHVVFEICTIGGANGT
jgi:hypothetical protein